MDFHDAANKEAAIYEDQLENGVISQAEFNEYMRDLAEELREYEQH